MIPDQNNPLQPATPLRVWVLDNGGWYMSLVHRRVVHIVSTWAGGCIRGAGLVHGSVALQNCKVWPLSTPNALQLSSCQLRLIIPTRVSLVCPQYSRLCIPPHRASVPYTRRTCKSMGMNVSISRICAASSIKILSYSNFSRTRSVRFSAANVQVMAMIFETAEHFSGSFGPNTQHTAGV